MTRADVYRVVSKLIHSGVISGEAVDELRDFRVRVCKGEPVKEHKAMFLLRSFRINKWIDGDIRKELWDVSQVLNTGQFEDCEESVKRGVCDECAHNIHFSWSD